MKRRPDAVGTPAVFHHVTNGGHARTVIEAAGLPGGCSIWSDPLYEGPVPGGLDDEALIEVRAEFLAGSDRPTSADVAGALRQWRRAILDRAAASEIVLWFEHDLFDQLNLVHLLVWLRAALPTDTPVTLVSVGSFPGRPGFKGFGELSPAELAPLFGTRRDVTGDQYDLAARAWAAFTAPEPLALDRLRHAETAALPFLADAITRFLQDYPWTIDGLSRSERRLLRLAADGPVDLADVFPRMSDGETAYYITDGSLAAMAGELSRGSAPLLVWEHGADGRSLLGGSIAITAEGSAVLGGERDRTDAAAVDRWHGGVHLSGEPLWRWCDAEQKIVPTPPPIARAPRRPGGRS